MTSLDHAGRTATRTDLASANGYLSGASDGHIGTRVAGAIPEVFPAAYRRLSARIRAGFQKHGPFLAECDHGQIKLSFSGLKVGML